MKKVLGLSVMILIHLSLLSMNHFSLRYNAASVTLLTLSLACVLKSWRLACLLLGYCECWCLEGWPMWCLLFFHPQLNSGTIYIFIIYIPARTIFLPLKRRFINIWRVGDYFFHFSHQAWPWCQCQCAWLILFGKRERVRE